MPLINGQKMACEPCIRGHRSTKCTHANERLMVPVRKPGRPLSSCPHPPSRPCSCGGVTAAIPRKQKCGCGPSNEDIAEIKAEKEDSSVGPTSPTSPRASSSAFRVQKAASKGAAGRKQSMDVAKLEKMDASQLNILQSFDGPSQPVPMGMTNGHHMPAMPGMLPYGMMSMTPGEHAFAPHPMMLPAMFQPPLAPPMMSPSISQSGTNGHVTPVTNGTITSPTTPTAGGCCGGKKTNGTHKRTKSQTPPVTAVRSNGVETTTKSCCASKADKAEPRSTIPGPPQVQLQTNGMMMPHFPPPIPMQNGMYPFYPQPNVFHYPPNYGSYMHPLQPEQWRQMMTAYMQPVAPAGLEINGGVPFTTQTDTTRSTNQDTGNGTSHECSCGKDCQCVGCAAHPYNQATQDYVMSAWNSMGAESGHSKSHSNGHVMNGNDHGSHNGSAVHTPIDTTGMSAGQGDGTDTAPQTPSDAASSLLEEQTLSANDFFFVSYPFGGSCEGETSSCPCGDDCQCIGCSIHNNPAATVDPV